MSRKREEVWIDPRSVRLDPDNTNVMASREFMALIESIRETGGLSENIVVVDMRGDDSWPHPEPYHCVSGEHRTRAAIEVGLTEIPARIFQHDEWDADMRAVQSVRHNVVRGNLDAMKFAKLVANLSTKYGRERVREMMKFTDKSKFDKLVDGVTKSLPDDVRKEVKKAKDEGRIETIDQLSRIVNEAFKAYGDTLPLNFLVFDQGGKKHIWVRMDAPLKEAMDKAQRKLSSERKSMSELFTQLLTSDVAERIMHDLPTLSRPDRGSIFDTKE